MEEANNYNVIDNEDSPLKAKWLRIDRLANYLTNLSDLSAKVPDGTLP